MERIEQKIVFNYLIESQRKVINNTERSIVIKKYMDANNLSFRELSKQIGIPHSTLNLWVNGEKSEGNDNPVFIDGKITSLIKLLQKDIAWSSETQGLMLDLINALTERKRKQIILPT